MPESFSPQSATRRYVVASSKNWHQSGFDALKEDLPGDWSWVATTEDLLAKVRSIPSIRYIFFFHWSWLVPEEVLSACECVCFHMTDVPYGRGGSPLQNLIVAGHKSTKLSALRMVNEMDAGPVYCKKELSLSGRAEDIYAEAGRLSFETIRWMVENEPIPSPQTGEVATFKRRKPHESALPTQGSISAIYDHIRMLDAPTYPLAFVEHGEYQIEFTDACLLDGEVTAKVVIKKQN